MFTKRKRKTFVEKRVDKKDHTATILASVIVGAWVTIQFFLLTHVIDVDMREIVIRTLGTLDTTLGLVISYYFGSSKSSQDKDSTIRNMTVEAPPNTQRANTANTAH